MNRKIKTKTVETVIMETNKTTTKITPTILLSGYRRTLSRLVVRKSPKRKTTLNSLNKSPSKLKEKHIPTLDITIDSPRSKEDLNFQKTLFSVIRKNIDGWSNIRSEKDIEITPVKGALTNSVFFVTNVLTGKKMILRIYGKGVDNLIIDRGRELGFLKISSRVGIGPQLLCIFKNGRFEQFLESVALTKDDIRDEEISRKIASSMFRLHNIVTILPPENIENIIPVVWSNIDKWYELSRNIINTHHGCHNIERFDMDLLREEIDELKLVLKKLDSPIVFAHNDSQCGNILRLTDGSNQLAIIDLEYSGWNCRGFDIGNHFCEWTFDYHSQEPHLAHQDQYPNEKQQLNFLESYLGELLSAREKSIKDNKKNNFYEYHLTGEELLKKLKLEAHGYSLASHIFWMEWGILQSVNSQIDFDYLEYAWQRLCEFRKAKHATYKEILDAYPD